MCKRRIDRRDGCYRIPQAGRVRRTPDARWDHHTRDGSFDYSLYGLRHAREVVERRPADDISSARLDEVMPDGRIVERELRRRAVYDLKVIEGIGCGDSPA